MEHDYWHNKWKQNDIGFHETDGNPFLKKYISVLQVNSPQRVFVPLCGKTRDIAYLLEQGMEVVAVELNEMAIEQLFSEMQIEPKIHKQGPFFVYSGDHLSVFVGDVFSLTASLLGTVSAVYDRAALVALPAVMRSDYVNHIASISGYVPQLVLTFCYDQSQMNGPPFSLSEPQVQQLYQKDFRVQLLQETSVGGGLKGKVSAKCLVFALTTKRA